MKMVKVFLGLALAFSGVVAASGCCCMDMSSCPIHRMLFGSKKVKQAPGPQTVCPVMGGKIDKKLFVDYEGKRIYACCEGCLPKIRKDPAKYVKQLEDAGVVLEKVPAETP